MYEWLQSLATTDNVVFLLEIFAVARAFQAFVLPKLKELAAHTQATWDDTAVAWVANAFAGFILLADKITAVLGLVIPDKKPLDPPQSKSEAEVQPLMGLGTRPDMSDVSRRRGMGLIARGIARRAGLRVENLDAEQQEALLDYIEMKAGAQRGFRGLRDILDWMLNNPELIRQWVMLFISIVAAEDEVK